MRPPTQWTRHYLELTTVQPHMYGARATTVRAVHTEVCHRRLARRPARAQSPEADRNALYGQRRYLRPPLSSAGSRIRPTSLGASAPRASIGASSHDEVNTPGMFSPVYRSNGPTTEIDRQKRT